MLVMEALEKQNNIEKTDLIRKDCMADLIDVKNKFNYW